MHIHILGICGTFMGSLAQLAKAMGHQVSGSDKNVYPPMSIQLAKADITIFEGFATDQFDSKPDLVIVGNVISRGNPAIEYVLDRRIPYTSGPQWLADNVLSNKWVLAVAGTHGKTTTSSMLAWILEYAGFEPGYLIGGVPVNFTESARLGNSDFFVIEADEYDTAFFDKRSKFVHYHPSTLILNNLEFDHADIFPDLAAIQRQFHHLIRLVPASGSVIYPKQDQNLIDVIELGCWSDLQTLGDTWQVEKQNPSASEFLVYFDGEPVASVNWQLLGQHNMLNALAAVAAARSIGILPDIACKALDGFKGVKRRMELLGEVKGVRVYDDFAHHPTAIETTLNGLRNNVGNEKIIAIIEPRSNTMKQGVHKDQLLGAVKQSDRALWLQPESIEWQLEPFVNCLSSPISKVFKSIDEILQEVGNIIEEEPETKSHILIMSNGSFSGIHRKIIQQLESFTREAK